MYKNRKKLLMVDLYKLIHFGKDSVGSCVSCPLLVQVVGFQCTFYLQKLIGKGCYATFEVCSLRIPSCVEEIIDIVNNLYRLAKLYMLLLANKVKQDKHSVDDLIMKSFDSPEVDRVVEKVIYKEQVEFIF
jgi:hypothetical protein